MISDPQQAEGATELAIMPSLSREGGGFEKGPQLIAFGPLANAAGCLRQGAPADSRSGPAWSGSPARLGSRVESCVSSPKSRWVHMIDFPALCDSSPGAGSLQTSCSLSLIFGLLSGGGLLHHESQFSFWGRGALVVWTTVPFLPSPWAFPKPSPPKGVWP